MRILFVSFGIFLSLAFSRFIPHPPNFTTLIALSFYIPAIFGLRYLPVLILSFVITDLVIGFHSTILFTWGSVFIIGIISKYFNVSIVARLSGALLGAIIFYVITNFGFWLLGSYGYNLNGLVASYTMALPFFGYSIISTILFSIIIETIYLSYKKKFQNNYKF